MTPRHAAIASGEHDASLGVRGGVSAQADHPAVTGIDEADALQILISAHELFTPMGTAIVG